MGRMAGGISVESAAEVERGPYPLKRIKKMDANLKKTLPQEGTGFSVVGESLGGPSGSSCPSYSGEGKDRFRHGVPCNGDTRQLSLNPESLRLSLTNNPTSKFTSIEDRIASEAKAAISMVEKAVQALEANRDAMRIMEDKSPSSLQGHVLDGVVIVEKIASLIVNHNDRLTLEDAGLKIKNLLMKTMQKERKRILTHSQVLVLRRELVEKIEMVGRSRGLKTNSSTSEPTPISMSDVPLVKNLTSGQFSNTTKETPANLEYRQLRVEQELEHMVQALRAKKLELGKIEDQPPTFLHKYMLDGVEIIKKVAMFMGDSKDKLTLENAAVKIKNTVEGLLKVSHPTEANRLQMEKSPLSIKQLESMIPQTADTVEFTQDGEKLTMFLKKYLDKTIKEYLNDCEYRFLDEWENKLEEKMDKSQAAPADTETSKGAKRKIAARALSPAPEAVYDVWYEMNEFKDFAMKRIEKDAANKKFSERDQGVAVKVDSDQDAVRLFREQPNWWTAELSELRRMCTAARRQYSRSRRRRQRDEVAEMELYAIYRSLKKAMNAAVKKAKSEGKEVNDEDAESSKSS